MLSAKRPSSWSNDSYSRALSGQVLEFWRHDGVGMVVRGMLMVASADETVVGACSCVICCWDIRMIFSIHEVVAIAYIFFIALSVVEI